MSSPGPESRLQRRIRKALKKCFPSSYFVKNHGNIYTGKGRPDLEGCYQGRFYAFEVKMPGRENKLTAAQAVALNRIQRAGGVAELITSPNDAIAIIRLCESGRYLPSPYEKVKGIWRRVEPFESFGPSKD